MDVGYVKLHRKLLEWGWWSDHNTSRVFIYLLMRANWEAKAWRGMSILPGQLVTSRENISTETGISIQQVRTSLDKLKSTNEITIKTTNRFTLVTIVNWVLYQSSEEIITNEITSKSTLKQPTDNQQITNKQPQLKNTKKERSKEGKNTTIDASLNIDFIEDETVRKAFMEYIEYRRESRKKMSQLAADKAWNLLQKLSASAEDQIQIINQSIASGWIGLFALKGKEAGRPQKPSSVGNFKQREYSESYYNEMFEDVTKYTK